MSFSSSVKEELSRQISPARHCQIAEMAAIILSLCGRVKISASDRVCHPHPDRKCGCRKKILYIIEKNI